MKKYRNYQRNLCITDKINTIIFNLIITKEFNNLIYKN